MFEIQTNKPCLRLDIEEKINFSCKLKNNTKIFKNIAVYFTSNKDTAFNLRKLQNLDQKINNKICLSLLKIHSTAKYAKQFIQFAKSFETFSVWLIFQLTHILLFVNKAV